eukprot:m.17496 g.17496  ORF g.17496 m.17496 type:complete len:552 (+) comp5471_c0_seq1:39-1694(+)
MGAESTASKGTSGGKPTNGGAAWWQRSATWAGVCAVVVAVVAAVLLVPDVPPAVEPHAGYTTPGHGQLDGTPAPSAPPPGSPRRVQERATELLQAGRWHEAASIVHKGVQAWPDSVPLWSLFGEVLDGLKLHGQASDAHAHALHLLLTDGGGTPPVDVGAVALGYAAVISSMYRNFSFDNALGLCGVAEGLPSLPPAAVAVLLRLHAAVLDCKGDTVSALQQFESALRLDPPGSAQPGAGNAGNLELERRHADLLRRTSLVVRDRAPEQVVQALEQRLEQVERLIVALGPWPSRDQLPGHYIPGLTARPFWDPQADLHGHGEGDSASDAGSDATFGTNANSDTNGGTDTDTGHSQPVRPRAAVKVLQEAAEGLRREYLSLRKAGLLTRETECIHALGPGRGTWRRYSTNGYWHPQRDTDGCSLDTPVACRVARDVAQQAGATVLRVGYSEVDPNTWIQPHYGTTNGQLKFHLGLIVPTDKATNKPCATLRVANQTRAWQENKVLFFDDSFEHEVYNHCDSERVVLQVVIRHPDLPLSSATGLQLNTSRLEH